jgi:hypothetical protein
MAEAPTPIRSFDPSRHLSSISGKEYLEVKWRLVWLRTEHPDAVIETNLVRLEENFAIFEAKVTLPTGGSATGYGSEDVQGFRDFIEKAETKAIGRALGALGFGTQFTQDFEFGGEQGRVVDSPVARQDAPRAMQSGKSGGGPSDKQMGLIRHLIRSLNLSEEQLNLYVEKEYGAPLDAIGGRDVSNLIDRLKAKVDSLATEPQAEDF